MKLKPAALAALLALAACERKPATLALDGPAIVARDLDDTTLRTLRQLPDRPDAWTPLFSLSVGDSLPPVMGRYSLKGHTARFTPTFPLQPGRTYIARLAVAGRPALTTRLAVPDAAPAPPATVQTVYPSAPVWPQNLLRLYIQFSAPMAIGRPGTLSLVGADGKPMDEPFLPLGFEFWSPDHTRLTVLVDPGRVKQGIVPGPVLKAGERYTLVLGTDWTDARGAAVKTFSRPVVIGPAERAAIDLNTWRMTPPKAGSTAPLTLAFDRPMDRALLFTALGVAQADGTRLAGRADAQSDERSWTFTPDKPWRAGDYSLLVQPWIEDPAGNRPGVPFERGPKAAPPPSRAKLLVLPFRPR